MNKRVVAGIGLIAGALGLFLWTRKAAEEPPPPPDYRYATLQGRITDDETGEAMANVKIQVDGDISGYTDSRGDFRTGELTVGHHTVSLSVAFYDTASVEVDLVEGLQRIDFQLHKTPVSGDFEVHWATINGLQHATINIGDEVLVTSQVGNLSSIPQTIQVCCYLDGASICTEVTFTGGYQESGWTAWPTFLFTATEAGDYTVTLGTWSGILTVLSIETGVFYSPYGCIHTNALPYWQDSASLVASMIAASSGGGLIPSPVDYRDCVSTPPFYASGYGTQTRTYIHCVYCGESIYDGLHDYTAIVNNVLTHIQQRHPSLPLNEPPCWVILTAEVGHHLVYLTIDGSVQRYTRSPVTPGTHHIVAQEPVSNMPPITLIDTNVSFGSWGDRVIINIDTGVVTTQTWEELI